MKNLRLLFVLISLSAAAFGQCQSSWLQVGKKRRAFQAPQSYYAEGRYAKPINFDSLVAKIQIPVFDKEFDAHLNLLLDSLGQLPANEDIGKQISSINADLNSVFQLVEQDSVGLCIVSDRYFLLSRSGHDVKDSCLPILYRFW